MVKRKYQTIIFISNLIGRGLFWMFIVDDVKIVSIAFEQAKRGHVLTRLFGVSSVCLAMPWL